MAERWPEPPTRRAILAPKIVLMDDGDFGGRADDVPQPGT
jgi:hypothetical protein